MENFTEQKTKGLEKLEFLTDKAKRFVSQLESEENDLTKLHDEIRTVARKRKELEEMNRGLKTKLVSLQNDREKVDEKISKILSAIGELPLD